MRTLKEIAQKTTIFDSFLWKPIVDQIRDKIDQKAEGAYITNIIDEYIINELGSWEAYPSLITTDDGDDFTVDVTALRRHVDTVIGTSSVYWQRLLESIELTTVSKDYSPLWNVDEHTTENTTYGEHETENSKGAVTVTDTFGTKKETNKIAKITKEDGLSKDKVTDYKYAQDQTTYTTGNKKTIDNAADNDLGIEAGQTVKHKDGQKTVTRAETTMDNVSAFKNKWQETTDMPDGNKQDVDTIGQKLTKEIKDNDTSTRNERTDTVTEHTYTNKETITQDANGDIKTLDGYKDTHTTGEATDTVTSKQHKDEFERRRYGNIGVTMSGQLIEDWMSIMSKVVPVIATDIAKQISLAMWF